MMQRFVGILLAVVSTMYVEYMFDLNALGVVAMSGVGIGGAIYGSA